MAITGGALTDANGDALTSQLNGTQQALDVGVNVAGVQVDPRNIRTLTSGDNVTVAASALPSGAATSANQTTANSSLASIDSKLTSPIATTTQTANGVLTNRSGTTSATANISTTIIPANPTRKYLIIQNNSGSVIWINFTNAATESQPSFQLSSGASFTMESGFVSTEAITAISGKASAAFTAKEA